MTYRHLNNTGEKIIAAVIKIGAESGICHTSAAKVAKEVGVSDFTVGSFFGSTRGYIDAATKSVDEQLWEIIYDLIDQGHSLEEFWILLHEELLKSPDSVLYYKHYKAEIGIDLLYKPDKSEWLPKARKLFGEYNLAEEDYPWLWMYTLTSAIRYAEDAICCPTNEDSTLRNFKTKLFFSGINSVLE